MAAQICEFCKNKYKGCYCSPNSACSQYEAYDFKSGEIIEEILGLDIKVKTNKHKEVTLCIGDFENPKDPSIVFGPDGKIAVQLNCTDYSSKRKFNKEQEMNIDKAKVLVTTNKFEQLKDKYENLYNRSSDAINSASYYKDLALRLTLSELLDILSDMVMED